MLSSEPAFVSSPHLGINRTTIHDETREEAKEEEKKILYRRLFFFFAHAAVHYG